MTTDDMAMLTQDELAGITRYTVRQLQNLVAAGRIPRPVRIGRNPRYRRSEIMAWIAAGCPAVGEPAQTDGADVAGSQADDSADAAN